MHHIARALTTRDTLLLIVHAANDEVAGRTVMQKLAYFCGLELGTGFRHRAHFYGPYSARVEDALANAVIAGELHETVERAFDWRGGPEIRKYTYALEPDGRARVKRLVDEHPNEWKHIRAAIAAIKDILPDLDQQMLSSAAKTYLIISESEEGVDENSIPSLARRLGWELDPDQVRTTVALLEHLDLLAVEGHSESVEESGRESA